MKEYFTIDDFDYADKVVLVRINADSPIVNGKVEDNPRLSEDAKLLGNLASKNAKVVALGHQSRPGKDDCISLRDHAKIYAEKTGLKIKFVDDIFGEKTIKAIRHLKSGEILILDNARFYEGEMVEKTSAEHHESELVQGLEKEIDYVVQNAFTNAHRAHASMIGFTEVPNIAGPLFNKEISSINEFINNTDPLTLVLGGLKIDDYLVIIEKCLKDNSAEKIIAGGALGELCLMAKGIRLGAKEVFFEKELLDMIPKLKTLLEKYDKKWLLPEDVAISKNNSRKNICIANLPTEEMIFDIGDATIDSFTKEINKAKKLYVKGPMGAYDKEGFTKGSRTIMKVIAESKAVSLVGGGHSSDLAEETKSGNFNHVSLAGGATLKMIAGEELPTTKFLKSNYIKFKS
ncbi:MAG: phosphoglycerate kinase [bacterium]